MNSLEFSVYWRSAFLAPPRTIPASRQEAPILFFSDGSCEEINGKLVGAIGAVMFGGECRDAVRAFGSFVPECLMEQWQNVGKRHLIGPVEMYAVVLARTVWMHFLRCRRIIYFIDHCGVMNVLSSIDKIWRSLLAVFEKLELEVSDDSLVHTCAVSVEYFWWSFTWSLAWDCKSFQICER